jgi:hypothetical protein
MDTPPFTPATLLLTFDLSGALLHLPGVITASAGAALCFLMRLVAIRRRVSLPVASEATGERPIES